jgi:YcxB-like protein
MELDVRLEVEYQLEFGEFYRGLRWYAWRKCWWIYCGIILALPALVSTIFREENLSGRLLSLALNELFGGTIIALWLYWAVRRNAQKQFETNSGLRVPRHSVFSKEGVSGASSVGSGAASWEVLHRVLETPESFLFFNSNVTFSVFPKRALGSAERVDALRNMIREQIGTKAKLTNN